MKPQYFLLIFLFSFTSLKSQIEKYDSLYTITASDNFNFRNPSFEEKDLWGSSTDITLTYEKHDLINSHSDIIYRKSAATGIGPEVSITNDNFMNIKPASAHTIIAWQTNRNGNSDIYYSLYSNSNWSPPAPLGLLAADETQPSAAEVVVNGNKAYFITYESLNDIFLKIIYQGNILNEINLTANVSEACSSPKIKFKSTGGRVYISYLKNINSLDRIIINPAIVNTDFSLNWQPVREIIQSSSASNLSYENGGNFLQSFLTYNYDTLGSVHSLGIDLMGYSKVIFTDQFPGNNFNGTGATYPIITDNSSTTQYFTTFGWNKKNSDSSFIVASVYNFPLIQKKFYLGDSGVSARPDISDYVINTSDYSILFRIVWEQEVNGRFVIMESRYRDFLNSIPQENVIDLNYYLSQNYPNPFNPNTTINYSIPSNVKGQTSDVKLIVYNNLGKEILTLVNEKQNPGSYAVDFNGDNLSSGIYFYRLEARNGQADNFFETKSMILLK